MYPQWTPARRLRAAREEITGSISEFAELAGISRRTIFNYERGGPMRQIYLNRWAEVCNVTVEWILTGVEPHHGGDDGGIPIIPIDRKKRSEAGREQVKQPIGCLSYAA